MKAIVYEKYGSPDVLELRDVEKPVPKDNEVLVRVRASSANAADLDLLKGTLMIRMGGLLKPKYRILGSDIAGQIEEVGSSVDQFKAGDEVFGDLTEWGFGAFAEYVCAPQHALAAKPARMTFEEAASVPSAGGVALLNLCAKTQIHPGHTVLINGAGGGMGTFAVQIAKSYGAEVTGVDSTEKLDTMRSIGANKVVDYTREDFTKNGLKYDLILDVAAHHSISDYKQALAPGGTYVMVGGSLAILFQVLIKGPRIAKADGKNMGIVMAYPGQKELGSLKKLIDSGVVAAVIDRSYPLAEVAEALRYLDNGLARGKVTITM